MDVVCASCEKPFQAVRTNARFCGPTCRKRGSRGALVELPKPARSSSAPSCLSASVIRELEAAERLDSTLGQAALHLAVRLESQADTGSAVASLTRELRATLAEAVAGARVAASPLERQRDELAERRRRKTG